ncbi:factor arrest protein 11 [Zygosaccharomyces mellis]|uniref:Factor arrest protein 11 n=1 Tax=Zygosaccharomyces mellis TaxID=42258 RepID=A0A4C2E7S4_9SACH|nr:factor arrest protein 11 [Zygosaccharomyces mellis]
MCSNDRPDLPLRSVSLDNLRPKSSLRKKLKFMDGTSTRTSSSASGSPNRGRESGNELLLDLNNVLRTKLKMDDPIMNSSGNSNNTSNDNGNGYDYHIALDNKKELFKKKLGLEGEVITKAYENGDIKSNECQKNDKEVSDDDEGSKVSNKAPKQHRPPDEQDSDEMGDDEDEEDEFANVDEIDGPISGKQNDDKLENEDLDIDYNMPIDEEYKRSLDERAAEFDRVSRFQPTSQPRIEWSLRDFYSLQDDLAEWFCSSDFSQLDQAKSQFDNKVPEPQRFLRDDNYALTIIAQLCQDTRENVLALTYISMGTFGLVTSLDEQIQHIRRNTSLLCSQLSSIIDAFKIISISCKDEVTNLKRETTLLFYSCTILFFITNVCIEQKDNNFPAVRDTINIFHDARLLPFLTRYIEHWRWNSRLSMRIRNVINLLFKLLVLQFGDKAIWKRSKAFLYDFHNLSRPHHSEKGKILTISPLHYQAFREDITARFPGHIVPSAGLPPEVDNSNSLSQFLEIPRSKAKNPVNLTLAAPQQHIATPAPSPPGSPNLLQMDTVKHRKSFQTNMAYPCLFPSDDEEGEDELTKKISLDGYGKIPEVIVPYGIQEATKILSDNVHIKLSAQQLWHERDLFTSTERGWKIDQSEDKYNYPSMENSSQDESIDIMKRVDSFYNECFSSLNSLVFVLLQTVESNLSNIDYRNSDIPADTNIDPLIPRLEITRAKELTMKSSFGILYVLLRWFKLNHILKQEHLCVLLHDSRYIQICCSLLGKYSENYSDKAFNRMLSSPGSIWRACSNYNPTYQQSLLNQQDTEKPPKYNVITMSSLAYMLKILRRIVGDKTERLKQLPLNIGLLFKRYYRIFNMDIYHPILRIIKELTPFKNKRWKSEHMELISGVFLYEKLELIDNWVTGKDISSELGDACGQEIAMRALLQFYNFLHYKKSMEDLGYGERSTTNLSLLNKESEYLGM